MSACWRTTRHAAPRARRHATRRAFSPATRSDAAECERSFVLCANMPTRCRDGRAASSKENVAGLWYSYGMRHADKERRAAEAVRWTRETFDGTPVWRPAGVPLRYRGHTLQLAEQRLRDDEPLSADMRDAVVTALHRHRPPNYERWEYGYIGVIVEAVAGVWDLDVTQSDYAKPDRSACAVVARALRPMVDGGKAVEAQWRKAGGKARSRAAA